MANRIRIPDEEYAQRLKKAAGMTAKKGLDVLIVNSNDSDYANNDYNHTPRKQQWQTESGFRTKNTPSA